MKFAYYKRLNARQRGIYDRSDAANGVRVPGATDMAPAVTAITRGLRGDDRAATQAATERLVDAVLGRLHIPPVQVRVLAVRPSNHREELHGLYEYGGRRERPVISVWMRTAQRRQVVAFRTFMRTLLHEVVHHLDYQLLRLEDSYHTQGFYKRTESLYRQLAAAVAEDPGPAARAGSAPGRAAGASAAPSRDVRVQRGGGVGRGRRVPGGEVGHGEGIGRAPEDDPLAGTKRQPRRRGAGDLQPLLPFMD